MSFGGKVGCGGGRFISKIGELLQGSRQISELLTRVATHCATSSHDGQAIATLHERQDVKELKPRRRLTGKLSSLSDDWGVGP